MSDSRKTCITGMYKKYTEQRLPENAAKRKEIDDILKAEAEASGKEPPQEEAIAAHFNAMSERRLILGLLRNYPCGERAAG